ncbi:SPRY domain-containing 7-like [Brachionus plicatilis]|uniref:SPRY domain-containing protein 7 n=1 Tax=Brachionus plicatilis TaxID=10195 RepID=A0A3M7SKJ8_BRAPC|nr:SPRY domain-containing 7-like [Brachionus plicatilis]
MLDPFCQCFSFWSKSDENSEIGNTVSKIEESDVSLDLNRAGQDVVIVKNGKRLCGTGGAISNAPITQNKAYFEVKIRSGGRWGIGLSTKRVDLNKVPLGCDGESWVLRNDGNFFNNNEIKFKTNKNFDEGDIIGVTYDHELLNFFLNGDNMETSITGIRGTVYPVFYVDDGSILDVQFDSFYHQPPNGFDRIMIEKSIL